MVATIQVNPPTNWPMYPATNNPPCFLAASVVTENRPAAQGDYDKDHQTNHKAQDNGSQPGTEPSHHRQLFRHPEIVLASVESAA